MGRMLTYTLVASGLVAMVGIILYMRALFPRIWLYIAAQNATLSLWVKTLNLKLSDLTD